ncbi:MAG TPA: DUF1343 domain-containing protein [Bdellovibrionota bacterium]|jgi:uncharacterized protein YbbC (DUF1343 family)|nr:DUF1343 domain-containing protein [Bdellovibrionota bacterium]
MKLGIEVLLSNPSLIAKLKGKRLGLVAHPASVNHDLQHSLDVLAAHPDLRVTCAFGPQHGIRGDKQYNMIESDDFVDKRWKIPVHSLYGTHRRPTEAMLRDCDVLVYDLQDLGCRIYTYLTTLLYVIDEAEKHGKEVWVLDRPNPVGRPIEGFPLESGFVSFVGAWAGMPMRHGLTSGEMAKMYLAETGKRVNLTVVPMEGYDVNHEGGWPLGELAWVNPSPNIATLAAARVYCGTVLFEGTTLSEGRGTTRPLELLGGPGFPATAVIEEMQKLAPNLCRPVSLRACFFEPTFYKYKGELCEGVQIHADHSRYQPDAFQPYRLALLMLKALRRVAPQQLVWRDPPYEYEYEKLPIDLLNGTVKVRQWLDDPRSGMAELEQLLAPGETAWRAKAKKYYLY